MAIFKPNIYKKNIFEINYDKLKNQGIKCLVFDLDNTLGLIKDKSCPKATKTLIKELQKDFKIYISTNNSKKRIAPYLKELNIDGECWSLKPSVKSLIKIKHKNNFKKEEIAMIGDQLVTDILSGNRYKVVTILVEPLSNIDLKITSLNRKIENLIIHRYQKKGLFERGKYYE